MFTPLRWSKEVETCCSCNILIVKLYILIFCVLLMSYTIMCLFRCMHWLSCVKSFYVVRNLLQMHVELDACTRTLRKKNRELFYSSTLSFARILWRRWYWDEWNISLEHLWNDRDRGTPKYRQKGLTQHHFVHHKTRTNYSEIEPGSPRWHADHCLVISCTTHSACALIKIRSAVSFFYYSFTRREPRPNYGYFSR